MFSDHDETSPSPTKQVTMGSHSSTYHLHTNHTCLYSPALWLVLIARTQEGMARLSNTKVCGAFDCTQ